ncbi:hypothetical protein PUN28_011994 [Cardiocondyla obscurior]|uniref:Uncharacterized protein n=1 Tax=Cardiocondyla obscurior TaxID=286306 RepID=A0AAW2FDW7_9HYME
MQHAIASLTSDSHPRDENGARDTYRLRKVLSVFPIVYEYHSAPEVLCAFYICPDTYARP